MILARMWEARVVSGRLDEAVGWLRDVVVPRALAEPGCLDAEVFRAADEPPRVVLVTRWDGPTGWIEGEAPPGVLARADAWTFELVPPAS
jgi:hypothetical protein